MANAWTPSCDLERELTRLESLESPNRDLLGRELEVLRGALARRPLQIERNPFHSRHEGLFVDDHYGNLHKARDDAGNTSKDIGSRLGCWIAITPN